MIAALAKAAEINVIVMGDGTDDWLVAARKVVDGEKKAHDPAGIYSALTALLQQIPTPDAVELISHSQENNYLKLGEKAVLDANSMRDAPADLVDKLSGKTLRIVGCYTAVGDLANAALAAIGQALGMEIWGTTGLIGTSDLYPGGLKPNEHAKLLKRPATQSSHSAITVTEDDLARGGPPTPFTADLRERLFRSVNDHGRQVLDNLLPPSLDHYYTYPGLLRVPSSQSPLYAVDSPQRIIGRLDVLFQDQLLRVTRSDWGPDPVEYLFLLPRPARPVHPVVPVHR
ncbi:MAG TPA: hypothetical protein VF469_26690 [Kofleriaceae bacterium]